MNKDAVSTEISRIIGAINAGNSKKLNLPLMHNNILPEDREAMRDFLKEDRILTQSTEVEAFEKEWSKWLGVRYSVFVNSGASANLITMHLIRILRGPGEIIVPPLTWVSDIASVMHAGHKPVFVDIHSKTLGMRTKLILDAITPKTKAVFITHLLGLNSITSNLLNELADRNIELIEDCCESHGATFHGRKLGSFGLVSNFSFYYAHHMTTGEGGMCSTNDYNAYCHLRMLRSHGLLRECNNPGWKESISRHNPDLKSDFIFIHPAFNVRSTELNAVMGRNQLKRLDANVIKRKENLTLFLAHLDPKKYQRDFYQRGASPYALILVLKNPDKELANRVETALKEANVEFRRGLSGGGNQLRQPYWKGLEWQPAKDFPRTEHIHFFSWYMGNYPDLKKEKIICLANLLNSL